MKKGILLLLAVLLLTAGCSRPPQSSSSSQPASQSQSEQPHPTDYVVNKALNDSPLLASMNAETLAAVKIFYSYPPQQELAAATLQSFDHEPSAGTYFYIVPHYAGSEILIESVRFNEADNTFVTDQRMLQAAATDDYGLLLQSFLPEGGPQLRITITYDGKSASYEPVYDGRGDTVYPVKLEGILLDQEVLPPSYNSFAFRAGPKAGEHTQVAIGESFLGWTLDSIMREADGGFSLAAFSGQTVTLRGSITLEPDGTEHAAMGGLVQFMVDEEYQHLLPYAEGDTRSLWFGISNSGEAIKAMNLTPGNYPSCEITIDSYEIDLTPTMSYNRANFVSGKVL